MATKTQYTDSVTKNHPAQVDAFGCNGKTPQTAVTAAAAATDLATVIASSNVIRAALIANGILV